jgi:hypothetical protein
MRSISNSVASFLLAFGSTSALADCWNNAERVQTVYVHSGAKELGHWTVDSSEIHRVQVPNGFEVGIQIEPATAEKYQELLDRLAQAHATATSELVKISLYDMKLQPPKLLTYTWGGTNSFQGYGALGGADRVGELGLPGIRLTLFKPVCVTKASLAAEK